MISDDEVRQNIYDIIQEIRNRRIEQRLNTYETAARLGISQGSVCNLESMRYVPDLRTLMRYANAVGYDLLIMPMKRKELE